MDYYPVEDYRPVTIQCVLEASVRRDVPANVLLAIAQIEGGKEGTVKSNKDGSFDFGRFQVNSVHLKELSEYGVSADVAKHYLTHDGCYSADYAAYRLQRCFSDRSNKGKDFWTKAACYHSKTPSLNATYQEKLRPAAMSWAEWLSRNFKVREIKL